MCVNGIVTWQQRAVNRPRAQFGIEVSGYLHQKLQLLHHGIQHTPAFHRMSILRLRLVQKENLWETTAFEIMNIY